MSEDSAKNEKIRAFAVQSMLKDMTDMMFIKDMELVYISASQSLAKMLGLKDAKDIVGKTDAQLFVDEELIRRYTDDDRRLLASKQPLKAYIEPFRTETGGRGYCQTSKFPLFDEQRNVIGLYGIARDVTWEYKAKLNYERELSSLFQLPPDALSAALFDVTNWRIVDVRMVNKEAQKVMNFKSVNGFIQESIDAITCDEEIREFYRSLTSKSLQEMYESGKRRISVEYQRSLLDKSVHWVHNDMYFISDPIKGNLCIMSILLDIEQKKKAEHELVRAAERDALTDVYNRETTMAQIRRFLSEEGANGIHLLFMIDVDNFKLINDSCGHQKGDEALVHIATAIRNVFRDTDIVGRIGGDEFFALMKNAENPQIEYKKAEQLVEALQYHCAEGGICIELSGSVGISRYDKDGKPLEQLYAEADSALYRAKHMGKNCFAFSDGTADLWRGKEPLNAINLRTILENMDASMFQTELDERGEIHIAYSSHSLFKDVNQEMSGGGAHGENIWNVILPTDLVLLKTAIREATVNDTVLDFSCRVQNSKGQIEWRHIRGTKLPPQGDGILRMIHVATDISKQKQTEVELREKNSIIDLAMRNTDINLWYFDFKKAACQLTQSCQKAHEMPTVEELENFPECLFEIGYVRDDCIELLRDQYKYLREVGKSTEFDVWFRKADGTGWWCEREVLSPLVNEDGSVTHGIGIGKDVTAEKVLEERYEAFGSVRRMAEKDPRVSFHMNLTTGKIQECISGTQEVQQLYQVETVDAFLESICKRIAAKDDLHSFNHMFSRKALLQSFSKGENIRSIECRYRIEDEHIIWLQITAEMMKNPVTSDVEVLLYSFDIDHEKNMRFLVDKLLEDDYEFLGLIDVITGRLMVFGDNMDAPGMARNGSLYEEEMKVVFKGLILPEYYEEGVRNMSYDHVKEELKRKKYYTCSFPTRDFAHTQAGRKQWKFGYLDDSKSKILMARTDITSTYTAEYDPLTGLYNRETFYRRTRQLLETYPTEQFIMVRFDIDRFKVYNDVYGTQAGDYLLAEVGKEAREKQWTEKAVFGRLEADHFVFVMPAKQFQVDRWSKKHMKWLLSVSEGYRLSSSIGVYQITDPTTKISLMCDRALLALRTVKDNYTKKIAWYDESLREKLMMEQALVDEMEQALVTNQFQVYFQPQINYNSGSLIGAEALVRWKHPKRGLIPPGEFIPLFEKNGFILKLDSFVWEMSCKYLRSWMDNMMPVVPVAVNVSRCDLYDPELCQRFQSLLEEYRLPADMLKLEITESAYMEDPEQLVEIVITLRSLGFTVEMDDFGTGYSSLNMLKDIPVDILKLDTRFISDSKNDMRSATILSSVISMAHEIGLSVIAEGVETKAQAELLKTLNCSNMQGYYFGYPMPEEEYRKFLKEMV